MVSLKQAERMSARARRRWQREAKRGPGRRESAAYNAWVDSRDRVLAVQVRHVAEGKLTWTAMPF